MSPAVRPNLASAPARALNQVLANEVDFGAGLRLRIAHHHDVESIGLILAAKREIHRRGQRPGRRQALVGQVEIGGRAFGIVMAVEARQIGLALDRRHEPRRLDDEDRRLVRQRQRVAAIGAGDGDVAAVRDKHAGEPRIGAGHARAVPVLEHDSRDLARDLSRDLAGNLRPWRRLRLRPLRLDGRQRKAARRAHQHAAARESIAMMLRHFPNLRFASPQEMARA